MIALLLAAAAAQSPAVADRQIRAQRAAFNRALATADFRAIANVLADEAQMVTGADSMIVAGKAAQLALWSEDLQGPRRRVYVRTTDRVQLSPVAPMALETGHWRGHQISAPSNWASGEYVAKWRRIDGAWKIESETYMATACGGTFCPTRK